MSTPSSTLFLLCGKIAAGESSLADTEENLRGFEIADPDGYVCFFGRPASG